MMRKSEFLRNLGTATTRFISTNDSLNRGRSRGTCARRHLEELGIFHEDPNHLTLHDNPAVRAVVYFGIGKHVVATPIEHAELIEDAWEYFQRKSS